MEEKETIIDTDFFDGYVPFEVLKKIEEGERCPQAFCQGYMQLVAPENCSCHINPPCSNCVNEFNVRCTECGFEIDLNAIEDYREP